MSLPTPLADAARALAAAGLALATAATPLSAQLTPLYEDYIGASPGDEAFTVVAAAPGGDYYAAGVAEGPAGATVEAIVYRIGPNGEARWDLRLGVGPNLRPFGLRARASGDSVDVALVELSPGEEAGALHLAAVGAAGGNVSGLRRVDLPLATAYRPGATSSVPGTDDLLVGGELEGLDRGGDRAFVARVRPDGSVAWLQDDLSFGRGAEFLNRVTGLRVVGDRVYAAGEGTFLGVLGLGDGAIAGSIGLPYERGFGFGDNYLDLVGDTLYWVAAEIDALSLTRVVDGAEVGVGRTSLEFGERFGPLYGVRAEAAGAISAFGAGGRGVTRFSFDADGEETARTSTAAPDFERLDPELGSQPGLLTSAGAVITAGATTDAGGGADAALARLDPGATAAVIAAFGAAGQAAADANALEVVPRADGDGVHVLYVTASQLYLRTLDAAGAEVADVRVGTDQFVGGFYGAAAFPDGSVLAFALLTEGGFGGEYTFLRIAPTGEVLGEVSLGPLTGFGRPSTSLVAATPEGRIRVFYTSGVGEEAFTTIYTVDTDLRDDDFTDVETARDSFATVDGVLEVPGSDDRIIYGSTGFPGFAPNYVARLTPFGDVVWRYRQRGSLGTTPRLLGVVAREDGYAVIDEDPGVALLDTDGRLVSRRELGGADASIDGDFGDIRVDGGSPVVALFDEGEVVDGGRFEASTRLARIDVDDATIVPLVTLPSGVSPGAYREFGGRSYVVGSAVRGLGRAGYVGAWAGELSPVRPALDAADAVAYPNPVPAGATLRFRGVDPSTSWRLVDVLGRDIARLTPAGDGGVRLPASLPAGIYRAVTVDLARVHAATLVVE